MMRAIDISVCSTMDSVFPPISHYDASVFPDDTRWYNLFEENVARQDTRIKVFQAKCKGGEGIAIMPLLQSQNRFGCVSLVSMDNYYSVDFRPLCSTPSAKYLINPLLAQITRAEAADAPDILRFQPLDNDAPETQMIEQSLHRLGWRVSRSNSHINWVHTIGGSYESYMRERPSRLRSTLRKNSERLMALEGIRFSIHDGKRDIEDLVDSYLTINARSRKVPGPYDSFIPELITEMARMGQLRLGLLKIGYRPVAAHFWVVKDGHAYIYKLAHDAEFDAYSPSTVLMARMIQHVIEKDAVTRLDFLIGDDDYKKDWMTERRTKLSITAYNPSSFHGKVSYFFDQKVKPWVKNKTASSKKDLNKLEF